MGGASPCYGDSEVRRRDELDLIARFDMKELLFKMQTENRVLMGFPAVQLTELWSGDVAEIENK